MQTCEVNGMKWPCLVREEFCQTDIKLEFEQEGNNEYGEPLKTFCYQGKCNYQDSAKRILTDQKKIVQITGIAMFPGDICPELPVISGGTAVIYGVERRIIKGTKARNPDSTVNYTEVMFE